jgi:hypothetical protein
MVYYEIHSLPNLTLFNLQQPAINMAQDIKLHLSILLQLVLEFIFGSVHYWSYNNVKKKSF